MDRHEIKTTMTKLLITSVIIGAIEWLRTGYVDGLCVLWVGPALIMLDEWDPQEWARRKLEERNDC